VEQSEIVVDGRTIVVKVRRTPWRLQVMHKKHSDSCSFSAVFLVVKGSQSGLFRFHVECWYGKVHYTLAASSCLRDAASSNHQVKCSLLISGWKDRYNAQNDEIFVGCMVHVIENVTHYY